MLLCFGIAAGVSLASPAQAQDAEPTTGGFGTKYPLVLSLENLGGVMYTRYERDGSEAQGTLHTGTFIGNFASLLGGAAPIPRIGVHYFVAPPLSIGLLMSYSDNDNFGTTSLIGARVGAAFPISDSTALWLRGGILYTSTKTKLLGDSTVSDVRPGGDLLFAIEAVDHFGFLIGGHFEIGVNGKIETDNPLGSGTVERDFKYMEAGLTAGVFADF